MEYVKGEYGKKKWIFEDMTSSSFFRIFIPFKNTNNCYVKLRGKKPRKFDKCAWLYSPISDFTGCVVQENDYWVYHTWKCGVGNIKVGVCFAILS